MPRRPPESGEVLLRELFALNVLLQLADGGLTYSGLALGFLEGNWLLQASMSTLGVGTALVLYKAYACGLLLLVRRSCPPVLSSAVLMLIAVVMTLAALVPWIGHHLAHVAFAT